MIQHIYPNRPTALRDALMTHPGGAGTIYLHAGVYEEPLNIYPAFLRGGTSWGNKLLISAWGADRVTIRPPVGTGRVVDLAASVSSYIELRNLDLDATNCTIDAVKITYTGDDPINASHHIRIRGCEIYGAPHQGVLITGDYSQSIEILNCNIHHNGTIPNQDHGIYGSTSYLLVRDCDVHHNAACGIAIHNQQMLERMVAGSNEGLHHITIQSNRCYANSQSTEAGHGSYGGGISISTCRSALVTGNACWENGIGIQIYTNNPYASLIRNTLWRNTTAEIENQNGEAYEQAGMLYP